jgi:hypothetical protein
MSLRRWQPAPEPTEREELLLKRLAKQRKLFRFLRLYRHELFDDAFQRELEAMYRDTGAGKEPVPPALMAMALLLQSYDGTSDAESVERTVIDLRWQMVLDCLGATEPAFSQGALWEFRQRLVQHEMDRRLLERTIELARATNGFDWKKLKEMRIAVDSAPLEGAGRVEDTFNLLGHAARKVAASAAALLDWPVQRVYAEAGIPLLAESSIKRALDIEWSDPRQKQRALNLLLAQLESLQRWVEYNLPEHRSIPRLQSTLDTLQQIINQDLEPDPGGDGQRVRQGIAVDRRVSIEDSEMRHGRKSKSKKFNGYKRHIATDLDTKLIMGCALMPANRPEDEAVPALRADLQRQQVALGEVHIDRAYIHSLLVNDVLAQYGEVVCKPWGAQNTNSGIFSKRDFHINMRDRTITCPAGEVQRFRLGMVVKFEADTCGACDLRANCVRSTHGKGRTIHIGEDEPLQHRLRKQIATPKGRSRLRERVAVEHHLAHIVYRQGHRARYRGVRLNLFDLRRAAIIQNLETIQRKMAA